MRKQTVIFTGSGSKLAKLLAEGLERAGFSTVGATNWRLAVEIAALSKPALILFDAESVDAEVWEAWHQVIEDARVRDVPFVLLAGKRAGRGPIVPMRTEPPAGPSVLPSPSDRVDASSADARMIRAGSLVMDLDRHTVTYDGVLLSLTPTEFRILHLLASHSGHVVLRAEIQKLMEWSETPQAARVHVTGLRRKLGSTGAASLKTVRGVGFIWSDAIDRDSQPALRCAHGGARGV